MNYIQLFLYLKHTFMVSIFLLTAAAAAAQPREALFKPLTIHDGLSQNTIYAITQDSFGFIWIGTEDGLNRYDGSQIITYYHDPADSNSLSSSAIVSLCADHRGFLWAGTESGINRINRRTGAVSRFYLPGSGPLRGYRNYISAVYLDRSGTLWAGTLAGLFRFNPDSGGFSQALFADSSAAGSDIPVYAFTEDSSGTLLIASNGDRPCRIRHSAENGKEVLERVEWRLDGTEFITDMITAANGDIWLIGNYTNLCRYRPENGRVDYFSSNNNASFPADIEMQCLLQTEQGLILAGTYARGLYRFDPESSSLTQMEIRSDRENLLSRANIMSLAKDRQGNIWTGTGSNGIRLIAEKNSKLRLFQHYPADPSSICADEIYSIAEDPQGVIWLGTAGGGLDTFHPDSEVTEHFHDDPERPNSTVDANVWTILADSSGDIWYGTDRGLNRYNPRTNRLQRYGSRIPPDDPAWQAAVITLTEDHNGTLWIGTSGFGLIRYDRQRDVFSQFRSSGRDSTVLSSEYITALYTDTRGDVWIGSYQGAARLSAGDATLTVFSVEDHPFLGNTIQSFFDDGQGNVWIGSSRGLTVYSRELNSFKNYSTADGLPNNVINAVLTDAHRCIWFSTNQGISRLEPETGTFTHLRPADGLQSTEFNAGAALKAGSGLLYFGGLYGLNVFHPDSLETEHERIPLYITEADIYSPEKILSSGNGRTTVTAVDITGADTLFLSWRQNNFSLKFAALDFVNPERIRYLFRLTGFQDTWTEVSERQQSARFTNLPPAKYRFEVKAENASGTLLAGPRTLAIIIKPPFTQTLFFRLVLIAAGAGLIFLLLKLRLRQISRRNRLLRTTVQKRTREIEKQRSLMAERNRELKHEILRRKEIENSLRLAEKKYRTYIEQSSEGIFRIDFDEPVPTTMPAEEQVQLFYKRGYIGECNQALALMYGYDTPEKLIGTRLIDLHGRADNERNLREQSRFITAGYRLLDAQTEEFDIDGNKRTFINNSLGLVENGHLIYIWGTQSDISLRKSTEEKIRNSLKEKEVLLKEIHHRVKNNLAVISSLLNLQARYIKDESVRELFRESQSRVTSMARIHEKIYQSEDLAHIDFADYIKSTAKNLFSLYNVNRTKITMDIDVQKVELAVDSAVPCGLILNELISNALKHAFPPAFKGRGKISIKMQHRDGSIELAVGDNGVGIPKEIILEKAETLGLKLVYILAEEQLNGKVMIHQEKGTTFRILFNLKEDNA